MPSESGAGEAGDSGWDRVGRALVCKGLLCSCFFVFVSSRSLLDALKSEHGVINEKHDVVRIIYHFL